MFLTYGRSDQGQLVHIAEAKSGRACGLNCPFCGGPLVARKGRILAHHFGHRQTTCRPQVAGEEDLIPSYEGFYLMGLTRVQQRTLHQLIEAHGPRPFLAADLPAVTRKALVEKGCLSLWEQPGRFERLEMAGRLTAKGLAFGGGLTLLEFARLMQAAFERAEARLDDETDEPLAGAAREMLARELERLRQTSLYFLEIETGQGTLHKIGLTSRRLPERLAEIGQFVSSQTTLRQITPLYRLEGVAYVEGYFKAKYHDYRHPLGQATGPASGPSSTGTKSSGTSSGNGTIPMCCWWRWSISRPAAALPIGCGSARARPSRRWES